MTLDEFIQRRVRVYKFMTAARRLYWERKWEDSDENKSK